MFSFSKFYRKLRIRTQILCFQVAILVATAALVTGSLFFLSFYMITQFSGPSEQILITKQLAKKGKFVGHSFRISIEQALEQKEKTLALFSLLVNQLPLQEAQFSANTQSCLQSDLATELEFRNQFCYGIFGQDLEADPLFHKISNILTVALPILNIDSLFFASITAEQFYSVWPGDPYKNFSPQHRPWFVNHVNKSNITKPVVYSDPYLGFFGGIYITATTNITDLDKKLVGVGATDINTSAFSQIYEQNVVEVFIINPDGTILVSKSYDSRQDTIDVFWNHSLLGFDKDQFSTLYNFHLFGEIKSGECALTIPSALCLHSKTRDEDYLMTTSNITNQNFFVIIKTSTKSTKARLQELIGRVDHMMQSHLSNLLQFSGIYLGLLTLSYMFSVFVLQKPLENMIRKFDFKSISLNNNSYESEEVKRLHLAISHLLDESNINKMEARIRKATNIMNCQYQNRVHHLHIDPAYSTKIQSNIKLLNEFKMGFSKEHIIYKIIENHGPKSSIQSL